jgi:diguanylate cyclase (GGDEF)-like protein/PAS domain S-box-containing protein
MAAAVAAPDRPEQPVGTDRPVDPAAGGPPVIPAPGSPPHSCATLRGAWPVTPDGPAFLVDAGGAILDATDAALELLYPEERAPGRAAPAGALLAGVPLAEVLIGSDDDAMLRPAGSRGPAVPSGVRGPGGNQQHDAARFRVCRVPSARPGGPGVVLLVEIGDLVTAVAELAEERRRGAEVERVAGTGFWEFDPATGTTYWSPGHYAVMGIEPGTVVPGPEAVLAAVHPDDRERVARCWVEHRDKLTPIDVEYRIRRSDGQERIVHGVAVAQVDPGGGLARFTGSMRDVTQQRQTERQLEHDRAELLDAQRLAGTGSWSADLRAGGVLERSPALLELMSTMDMTVSGEAVIDDWLAQAVLADDRPAVLAVLSTADGFPIGRTREVEFRSPPPYRRVFVLRVRGEHDRDGRLRRLRGTLQDVTSRRRLELQLRSQARRLVDAQRLARLGTWEGEARRDPKSWSQTMWEITGAPPDAVPGFRTYLSLVHPEDLPWVRAQWDHCLDTRRPVDFEHRAVRPDGSVRVWRCQGAFLESAGPGQDMIGAIQDVTEQRAAETRVERSSRRFADLVSVLPVGIGLFDAGERLVDGNDALCELLGYPLERLRGLTVPQLEVAEGGAAGCGPGARIGVYLDSPGRDGAAGSAGAPGGELPAAGPPAGSVRVLRRADGASVYCELHVSESVQDDGRKFRLVVFSDVTERRRVAESLRHQALHDDLTGLPNRAAVKDLLTTLLATPKAPAIAVLLCDLDNFKRINDSLGHEAGDEVLVTLADRLAATLPAGCLAARVSGDEFVVICSDTAPLGGVDAVATKVAALLRGTVLVRGQVLRMSATVGAAVPRGVGTTPADLLRFADAAMFEAKRRGTGRVSLASAALMASADHQVQLEAELRDALACDGLEARFQPLVDASGAVTSAEALVRWPHPHRGLLMPDRFLPVAEQGDLMRELDRWMLRTALTEAAGWPEHCGRPVSVAVNLAAVLPGGQDFVEIVSAAIADSGIDPARVVLELVETSLIDLPARSRQTMLALTERGVRFAVDDFGTGYSSLSRLKELPAHIVKVDRSFVDGVGTDSSDFAVVRAVVDIARAMGRSCVAEGVERASQFHVLRGLNVDAYQGWLFSKAVTGPAMRELLAGGRLPVPAAIHR